MKTKAYIYQKVFGGDTVISERCLSDRELVKNGLVRVGQGEVSFDKLSDEQLADSYEGLQMATASNKAMYLAG